MKIAFLHYHLKRGGVTTVIKQQVSALKGVADTHIISGIAGDDFPYDVDIIADLSYDRDYISTKTEREIALEIIASCKKKFGGMVDILHVHNPTLSKNSRFLRILDILMEEGITLFLQIHDFAEDGRAAAYYFDEEYPKCHYGVINSRDYNILRKAGLEENTLHKVFNVVRSLPVDENAKVENIILYPVRAIRRKNIGEAILLSMYLKEGDTLAITLPPNSERDFPVYEDWKTFSKELNTPLLFEAGVSYDFESLVSKAKFMLSTSINEGFGFTFLEPWTALKAVKGRKLPFVCNDFEENGVDFTGMYEKIFVPLSYINKKEFFEEWKQIIETNAKSFRHTVSNIEIEEAFERITANNEIDFGFLQEKEQKLILRRLNENEKEKRQLGERNSLYSMYDISSQVISLNKMRVEKIYSEASYARSLLGVYNAVLSYKPSASIDKSILLKEFFDLDNFNPLKWGDYKE